MEPITMGLMAAGAASKLYGVGESIASERRLRRDLYRLNQTPYARYSVDPKLAKLYEQSIGEASAPEGYGGAEIANFRNNLGRMQRGRFATARNMTGGRGSRAINSVLNNQGMDAIGNFYAGDAGMRRTNRMSALSRSQGLAGQFQGIRDRNVAFDQNYRMQTERALGQGIRGQRDFRSNMLSGLGSDLITGAMAYGDFGGDDNTGITRMDRMRYRFNPDSYVGEGQGVTPELLTPASRAALANPPRLRR
jgi:hypothetical protein